jgi:hypothetical protein
MSDYGTLVWTAREAYAVGWARSGGPLTDRVMMGCAVAVSLACESPDAPDVIEATLKLGSLEGTWAAVYDRRERLYAKHTAAVTVAYRALVATLDPTDAITRLQRADPATEATNDDAAAQARKTEIAAAASAEATRLLHGIVDTSSPEYQATVEAIAGALIDAQAEGVAGAVAVLAQQTGVVGIDFDLAFADAHAALARLDDHWGDARGWLGRIVDGNATDLGQAWSRIARDGGDFEELRIATKDILDGEDIGAVDTLIDLAMGQSFSRGALALYAREGVTSVEFITAGGTRVCPLCMNAEAGNPWALIEAPHPALHPYCRCNLTPTADSVTSLGANLSRYLLVAA